MGEAGKPVIPVSSFDEVVMDDGVERVVAIVRVVIIEQYLVIEQFLVMQKSLRNINKGTSPIALTLYLIYYTYYILIILHTTTTQLSLHISNHHHRNFRDNRFM